MNDIRYQPVCGTVLVAVVTSVLCAHSSAWAVDLSKLVKRVGKVPDDVNIKRLDELAQKPATVRAGRDLLERTAKRTDDAAEWSRLLRQSLQATIGDIDPVAFRQLNQLDEASQQAALVLTRGARSLESGIPDISLRSRFIQDGGGEILCTLGRYDDMLDDAIRFDTAVRAGRITAPTGMQLASLQSFGQFFYEQGNRAHHFWTHYVRPHWKLWLGGAALTAVMLAPDEYLDAAGNLTKAGIKKVTAFGGTLLGRALSGAVEGTGEGIQNAARDTAAAFSKTFLSGGLGIASLLVLILGIILLVPFLRRRLLRIFRTAPSESRPG